MAISWFPGHMAKTRRKMEEDLKRVELVVELCDARIPRSSRNPLLLELLGKKPRILMLNKADLADDRANRAWLHAYRAQGQPALLCDCQSGRGVEALAPMVLELMAPRLQRDAQRGVRRPIRLMVAGIPNVGKSSLINRLSGKKSAQVEDRPGVTRTNTWIRLPNDLELLDTPGLLWPKFEEEQTALHLLFVGSIKDEVTDLEEMACLLASELARCAPGALAARYGVEEMPDAQGFELVEAIGRRRGFLISGGEVNWERTAKILLDEFRAGKLGRITLEWPEET